MLSSSSHSERARTIDILSRIYADGFRDGLNGDAASTVVEGTREMWEATKQGHADGVKHRVKYLRAAEPSDGTDEWSLRRIARCYSRGYECGLEGHALPRILEGGQWHADAMKRGYEAGKRCRDRNSQREDD
jgi:ribosome modulation factor